ncbi:MAG TPA: hypothetical protein VK403_12365 [Allosphingosinicella sp.]|nr:hypothetical protein [Allosphingosinicella sp.]
MKWSLLKRVEAFLKHMQMRPTRFGMESAGDPRLVFQLRRGRVPRPPLEAKILDYLDRAEEDSANPRYRRRRR